MKEYDLVGKRVRLDKTTDQYTKLVSGDEGVIESYDDFGTLWVKWDSGSSLGLIYEAGDRYTVILN